MDHIKYFNNVKLPTFTEDSVTCYYNHLMTDNYIDVMAEKQGLRWGDDVVYEVTPYHNKAEELTVYAQFGSDFPPFSIEPGEKVTFKLTARLNSETDEYAVVNVEESKREFLGQPTEADQFTDCNII